MVEALTSPLLLEITQSVAEGQAAATFWKRRGIGPTGQVATPPVGALEKRTPPSLAATQRDSLAQARARIGFSPAGLPWETQFVAPSRGFPVVQISPLKALATQRKPVQVTARNVGSPGTVARVQAVGPPVGLVEVRTWPPAPTTTQRTGLHSIAKRDFVFGIRVGVQEAAPAPGSVVVQTPPLKSTATQSVWDGQEMPRRLAFRFSAGPTWPTVQAPAPAVGAVDWITTPSWPTPMQEPLASQFMPKIVSPSPRLRFVSVQGDAADAVAAPKVPSRAARRARRRARRRTLRFLSRPEKEFAFGRRRAKFHARRGGSITVR